MGISAFARGGLAVSSWVSFTSPKHGLLSESDVPFLDPALCLREYLWETCSGRLDGCIFPGHFSLLLIAYCDTSWNPSRPAHMDLISLNSLLRKIWNVHKRQNSILSLHVSIDQLQQWLLANFASPILVPTPPHSQWSFWSKSLTLYHFLCKYLGIYL